MGPETTAHLTVHLCPPTEVRAVIAVLDEFGLINGEEVVRGQLTLGATYEAHEVDHDTFFKSIACLLATAPGTTWTAYAPPAEQNLGDYVIHDPVLGIWRGRCDVDNVPSRPLAEVSAARARGDGALDITLGVAWTEVVDGLRQTRAGDVETAVPAGYRAIWQDDTLTVVGGDDDGADLVLALDIPTGVDVFDGAEQLVARHIVPLLATADLRAIPGTWTRWRGVPLPGTAFLEGEVLARTLARSSAAALAGCPTPSSTSAAPPPAP